MGKQWYGRLGKAWQWPVYSLVAHFKLWTCPFEVLEVAAKERWWQYVEESPVGQMRVELHSPSNDVGVQYQSIMDIY